MTEEEMIAERDRLLAEIAEAKRVRTKARKDRNNRLDTEKRIASTPPSQRLEDSSENLLVTMPEATPRIRADGLFEGVNPDGSIAWVERGDRATRSRQAGHRMSDRYFEFISQGGHRITIPYDPKILKFHSILYPYMEEIAMEIARRLAEGDTLRAICASDGMPPYYVVGRWRMENPNFKKLMEEARNIRAELYEDEMIDVKDNVTEQTSREARVKLDALKHLAAINNPDTYGSKTKLVGDGSAPAIFIFNTGIERKQLEQNIPIEVEGVVIGEQENQGSVDGVFSTEAPVGAALEPEEI